MATKMMRRLFITLLAVAIIVAAEEDRVVPTLAQATPPCYAGIGANAQIQCTPSPQPTPTPMPPQMVQPSPTIFASPVPTATAFASITATTGTSAGGIGAWSVQVAASTIANAGTTAGDYFTLCAYASPAPTNHYGLIEVNCPSAPTGYTLIGQSTAFSPTSTLGDDYKTIGLTAFAQYPNSTTIGVKLMAACSCATSATMGPGVFQIFLSGI